MVCAAGCGAPSPAPERTDVSSSAIQDGTTDTIHEFAVAVLQVQGQQAAFCSGALLAPNLVATARHCVAQITSTNVDCATSTFGPVVAPSQMKVTTDAVIRDTSTFVAATSILVPNGNGQEKLCGNDIALLVLEKNVDLPQYVEPVLFPSMTDPNAYSTKVTAIGYGIDTPTDTQATSAGSRRIKQDIALTCIPNDKTFVDCFASAAARQILTSTEFVSGDASTCEGDSGSSAFEQTHFSQGQWVSFGVLSRGGVSTDGKTCVQPVYSRFDAWAPLLLEAANQAAAAGGYDAPAWAVASAPTSSDAGQSGAGKVDGLACGADTECLSGNCVALGTTPFVCASPCSPGACATRFHCKGGFCLAQPSPQAGASVGCALASPPSSRPRAVLAGLAFLAVAAARRIVARRVTCRHSDNLRGLRQRRKSCIAGWRSRTGFAEIPGNGVCSEPNDPA